MILRADNLRIAFRAGEWVLPGVSAEFHPGEFTAILGRNGSGKSTLLRALVGLTPERREGAAVLDGVPVERWSAEARADRLAFIPQREEIPHGFTVREAVRFGVRRPPDPGAESSALERLGLTGLADRRVETLSEGQRQRVALARAYAQTRGAGVGPGAVVADEPAAALDPCLAADAMGMFRELAALGRTVVVVLHDMNLALRYAHRALLMAPGGSILASGPAAEVLTPALLERAFGVRWLTCPLPDGGTAVIPAESIPTM